MSVIAPSGEGAPATWTESVVIVGTRSAGKNRDPDPQSELVGKTGMWLHREPNQSTAKGHSQ